MADTLIEDVTRVMLIPCDVLLAVAGVLVSLIVGEAIVVANPLRKIIIII